MAATKPSRWLRPFAFFVLYVGWGGAYLAARYSIQTIPPLLCCGAGFFTAGLLLMAWTLWREKRWPPRRAWLWSALIGLFMITVGLGGVTWAELRVTSGLAALIVSAEPVWMTLYEWVFEHRRPTWLMIAGLVLGLAGLVYLSVPDTGEIDRLGLVVLLVCAFMWIIGSLISRNVDLKVSELAATGLYMVQGGALLLIISGISGEAAHFHWHQLTRVSVIGWLYNTFFSSLIGFSCYVWLLRTTRVSLVSTYAFVNPVVALALGWWLAGETLSWHTGIAGALLIGGVLAITIGQQSDAQQHASGDSPRSNAHS